MKQIFLFILSCFIIISGIYSTKNLPIDTTHFIEEKYTDWSGVLHIWVSDNNSALSWLNACASEFEKNHPGKYINIKEVSPSTLTNLNTDSIIPPDIIIYPSTYQPNPLLMIPITNTYPLRESIHRSPYAVPILLQPSFIIYNTSLIKTLPADLYNLSIACSPSDLNALVALCTGLRSSDNNYAPLPGIDLGLAPSSTPNPIQTGDIRCRVGPNLTITEAPLNDFRNNKITAFIGGISDIIKLSENSDWSAALTGNYVYTSSALMYSIINKDSAQQAACISYLDTIMTYGQTITYRAQGFPAISGVSTWANNLCLAALEYASESRTWILGTSGTSDAAQLYIEEKITADEAMDIIIDNTRQNTR